MKALIKLSQLLELHRIYKCNKGVNNAIRKFKDKEKIIKSKYKS